MKTLAWPAKFTYRVMHACIEFKFKLKTTDKHNVNSKEISDHSSKAVVLHRPWKALKALTL